MTRLGFAFAALLMLGTAAAQRIAVPGAAPPPAAGDTAETDAMRRLVIGTWLLAAEYIGEDKIRHFTSITSVYNPDGTGTRTVVMETGAVDGSGTQIHTGGTPSPIFYHIEAQSADTLKIVQWTQSGSDQWEEVWKIVDPNSIMEIKTQLVWKRQ